MQSRGHGMRSPRQEQPDSIELQQLQHPWDSETMNSPERAVRGPSSPHRANAPLGSPALGAPAGKGIDDAGVGVGRTVIGTVASETSGEDSTYHERGIFDDDDSIADLEHPARNDPHTAGGPLDQEDLDEAQLEREELLEEEEQGQDEDVDNQALEPSDPPIPSEEYTALCCLTLENPIRRFCVFTVTHRYFQRFILLCIFLNSVMLTVSQPAIQNPEWLDSTLGILEYVFTVIFFLEAVLKITALGFIFHPDSYMRSPWNIMDLAVVIASIIGLPFVGLSDKYRALKAFRVLRPLRTVSRIKQLKHLIAGIVRALPMVIDNLLLLGFIMFIFAVTGVLMWQGQLNQRCYITEFPNASNPLFKNVSAAHRLLLQMYQNLSTPFLVQDDLNVCGGNHRCHIYPPDSVIPSQTCTVDENKYFRTYMNYNNIGTAALLMWKVVVMDNWPDDLTDAMNMFGSSSAIFFIALTLTGGFLCINLFLAILTQNYTTTIGSDDVAEMKKAEELVSAAVLFGALAPENMQDAEIQCDRITEDKLLAASTTSPSVRSAMRRSARNPLAETTSGVMVRSHSGEGLDVSATPQSRRALSPMPATAFSEGDFLLQKPNRTSSGMGGQGQNPAVTSTAAAVSEREDSAPAVTSSCRNSPNAQSMSALSWSGQNSNPPAAAIPKPGTNVADLLLLGHQLHRNESSGRPGAVSPSPSVVSTNRAPTVHTKGTGTPQGRTPQSRHIKLMVGGTTERQKFLQEFANDANDEDSNDSLEDLAREGEMDDEEEAAAVGYTSTIFSRRHTSGSDGDSETASNATGTAQGAGGILFDGTGAAPSVASRRKKKKSWLDDLDDRLVVKDDQRHWIRRGIGDFVQNRYVNLFMVIITLLNVICLGIDHYGIDDKLSLALDILSIIFTAFFAIHISLKIIAFGPILTFSKKMNVFDVILVLAAIPDIALSSGSASGFSIFRAFRLIRTMRILRSFESLQAIMQTIMDSLVSVAYLFLLILLFLYAYAILGMQLFGTDYGRNRPDVRDSFGTFLESVLLCFIVITGDSWTNRMTVAMDIGTEEQVTALIFFMTLYTFVNFVLINLFVAIVMDQLAAKMEAMNEVLVMPTLLLPECNVGVGAGPGGLYSSLEDDYLFPADEPTAVGLDNGGEGSGSGSRRSHSGSPLADDKRGFFDHLLAAEESVFSKLQRCFEATFYVDKLIVTENSLVFITPQNKFRKALLYILGSSLFDYIIMILIVANMIFLGFESTRDSEAVGDMLDLVNNVFAVFFVIEMLMKIIAFGAFTPKAFADATTTKKARYQAAYFRDGWNCVDAAVNLLAIVTVFVPVFKASRSLRTLRLMIRNDKTRVIIVAMLQAIPHVLQGLFFVVFLFIVFGIMGVQFFKGEFYICNDLNILDKSACIGNFTSEVQGPVFTTPVTMTRQWQRLPNHFDHIGASLLTLFIVAVGDGWSQLMYNGMDTSNPERALEKNAEPWMAIYFIVVFVSCNFFAFNMIVGILINYFSKKRKLQDGSALLTEEQRLYVKARTVIDQTLFDDDLIPLDHPVSQALGDMLKYRVGKSKNSDSTLPLFEYIMTFIILINVAFIAADRKDQAPWEGQMIQIVSLVCLCIFTVEVFLKLVAYGPIQYISVNWNKFDLLIVLVGWSTTFISGIRALSFLRVLRVIKIVKGSRIQRLLAGVVRSVISFLNVLALLVLTFFIFAVAGVILFGNVIHNGVLDNNNNFETVPNAMLVLYQISTKESWYEYMNACSIQEPEAGCSDAAGNCGGLVSGVLFFVIFMIICAFTVLQLFVAVVVEIFTEEADPGDPIIQGFFDMKQAWCEHMGAGCNIVYFEDFIAQLHRFPRVLTELPYNPDKADILRFLSSLSVPVDSKYRVTYKSVIHALAWRKYRIELRSLATILNESWSTSYSQSFTVAQAYAASLIQQLWREHRNNMHRKQLETALYQAGRRASAVAKESKTSKGAAIVAMTNTTAYSQNRMMGNSLFDIMSSSPAMMIGDDYSFGENALSTSGNGAGLGGSGRPRAGSGGSGLQSSNSALVSSTVTRTNPSSLLQSTASSVPNNGLFIPGAFLYAFPTLEETQIDEQTRRSHLGLEP